MGQARADAEQYATFRALLARAAREHPGELELCHEPFDVEAGLAESLASPPATLLVLPNGWVKVAAALPHICADLRRDRLATAWEAYRNAWSNDKVPDVRAARGSRSDAPRARQQLAIDVRGSIERGRDDERTEADNRTRQGRRPSARPTSPTAAGKPAWETPKLEDVSEQVMAQPYIRFT